MIETAPLPILQRFYVARGTSSTRIPITREQRPYICYGFSFWDAATVKVQPVALDPAIVGLVTLLEWNTLRQRARQVPLACGDILAISKGGGAPNVDSIPAFAMEPFVVDLAASYVEVGANLGGGKAIQVGLEFSLVPADAANLAACGLTLPR